MVGIEAGAGASPEAGEVRASPLARRLAEQHGIDLRAVRGSGPGGRIVQEDVERVIATGAAPPAPAAPALTPTTAPAAGATVPFAGLRRTIADRLHGALQQMAQLTITTEADVTELVRLRTQLVEEWQADGVRPTYTDLVVKAAARALRDHPSVNASLDGDVIRLHAEIHVGVAVALESGLIVPVVRQADRTPLKRLSRTVATLAERARAGTLGFDDVAGGTFSVTSLGMYEVDTFTPIINPPQAAILGVGRIRESVALVGREVVERRVMALSLTIDHRILDGAPAAEYLRRVKHLLERPFLLLMEEE
ncbi:MAG: dihydrolipoamide acetyltransferase family protein [Dehalococcoidia bacterium]